MSIGRKVVKYFKDKRILQAFIEAGKLEVEIQESVEKSQHWLEYQRHITTCPYCILPIYMNIEESKAEIIPDAMMREKETNTELYKKKRKRLSELRKIINKYYEENCKLSSNKDISGYTMKKERDKNDK